MSSGCQSHAVISFIYPQPGTPKMQAAQRSTQRRAFSAAGPAPRRSLVVSNALTREKKEQTVERLSKTLEGSVIVFGMRYKGLDVQTVQKFRKGLPESSSMIVCKNSLMKIACKNVPGWTPVVEKGATGENAWIFVPEDAIRDTVKHYFAFEKQLFDDAKKVAPKGVEVKAPTELSCIVMDDKYLSPAELKKCESLPTKKELLAKIAGMAKQPATKIATSIKQVPTKLALAIKKVSELDEDKTKTVASLVKAA